MKTKTFCHMRDSFNYLLRANNEVERREEAKLDIMKGLLGEKFIFQTLKDAGIGLEADQRKKLWEYLND